MYDRNGLELSPIQKSLNAYKYTAVNTNARNYTAYAQSTRGRGIYSMVTISKFDDPRDAAFVGQEFNKQHTEQQVYEMVVDKTFGEISKQFLEQLDIPVWQYPAEGLDWDDIIGENGYTKNRVDNARDALVEAFRVEGKAIPALPAAKKMIAEVDNLYREGMSFREAAKKVVKTC